MPITINNENYYTANELSKKFDVTMEAIRDWRKTKGLKFTKISERKYMYKEKDIDDFLNGVNYEKNNNN